MHLKYNNIFTLYVNTKVTTNDDYWGWKIMDKIIVMYFPIMYVGTGSILVMCTEHQLTCDWQTANTAVQVFIFHNLMYLNISKNIEMHKLFLY